MKGRHGVLLSMNILSLWLTSLEIILEAQAQTLRALQVVSIVKAVDYASYIGAEIGGVLGRDGGYTYTKSKNCVLIPVSNPDNVTPISESLQVLVWHLIISSPIIKINQTTW